MNTKARRRYGIKMEAMRKLEIKSPHSCENKQKTTIINKIQKKFKGLRGHISPHFERHNMKMQNQNNEFIRNFN